MEVPCHYIVRRGCACQCPSPLHFSSLGMLCCSHYLLEWQM